MPNSALTKTPSQVSTQTTSLVASSAISGGIGTGIGIGVPSGGSKLKFRSRKLEPTKPLSIYRWDEMAEEINDIASPIRSVPQVSTGVDKEEENEQHLQAALQSSKGQHYVIPTPDTCQTISDYDSLYTTNKYKQTKGFVKKSHQLSDEIARLTYNSDLKDQEFCKSIGIPFDVFEFLIQYFEGEIEGIETVSISTPLTGINLSTGGKTFSIPSSLNSSSTCTSTSSSSTTVTSISIATLIEGIPKEKFSKIKEWWNDKKQKESHKSLLFPLKFEDVGKFGSDVYVCFRQREIKQPRRTRRSEAQTIDKLCKMQNEILRIKNMIDAEILKDRYTKELVKIDQNLFEKYWQLELECRSHNRIWPDSIPPFREAIRSLAEKEKYSKNNNIINSMTTASTISKDSRHQTLNSSSNPSLYHSHSNSLLNSHSNSISNHPIKIQTLRNSPYFHLYYPIEVLKIIQKELGKPSSLSPSHQYFDDVFSDSLSSSSLEEDQEEELKFKNENNLFQKRKFHHYHNLDISGHLGKDNLGFRRGRSGRLLIDKQKQKEMEMETCPNLFTGINSSHLAPFQSKDYAQLCNIHVGNYNQHYLNFTSSIKRPLTFSSWCNGFSSIPTPFIPSSSSKKSSPNKKKKTVNVNSNSNSNNVSGNLDASNSSIGASNSSNSSNFSSINSTNENSMIGGMGEGITKVSMERKENSKSNSKSVQSSINSPSLTNSNSSSSLHHSSSTGSIQQPQQKIIVKVSKKKKATNSNEDRRKKNATTFTPNGLEPEPNSSSREGGGMSSGTNTANNSHSSKSIYLNSGVGLGIGGNRTNLTCTNTDSGNNGIGNANGSVRGLGEDFVKHQTSSINKTINR